MKRAPLPLRGLDAVARALGIARPELDLDGILTHACWATGLDDFGHPGFVERLERLLHFARQDHEPTFTGRFARRIFFHWHATNRLREVDYLARNAEVLSRSLPAPIIIVGGFRTGTTHLHALLACDERLRAPKTWELAFPMPMAADPKDSRGQKRLLTRAVFGLNQVIMPDQAEVHDVLIDGPEECHFLLENAALSMTESVAFLGHSFAFWLLDQDVNDAYASMKAQYQVLSGQTPEDDAPKPWLLKCPIHTWYLEELLRVFPDARLVWTHRPMRRTLPSTASLSLVTASKFFADVDPARLGDFWLRYYRAGLERGLRARDARPGLLVEDVRLEDLSRDPWGELRRIYDFLGLDFDDATRLGVENYLTRQGHAKDAPGKHRYRAADFGLDEAEIAASFRDYEERFGISGA